MSVKRAVPITLETLGGNYLLLDLGRGYSAFYAHLQPGSLRVKVGDKVSRGQVLGLLGNSGNSDAPHLHLHVADAKSPSGAEAVPFVFASFEVQGTVKSLEILTGGEGWTPRPNAAADKRQMETPVETLSSVSPDARPDNGLHPTADTKDVNFHLRPGAAGDAWR
jgi:murein DD-endopeptidase